MTLSLEQLTKSFDGKKVLRSISTVLQPGKIIALLGMNGAGKSTLLRCLTGLTSPTDGRILIDGELLQRDRVDLRRRLMFLPDFPSVAAHGTPLQCIATHLKLWEADRPGVEDKVADVMHRLQIASLADDPIASMSRGQSYKVALTCLIAVDPELWLLDEPFASGMDPMGITTFCEEASNSVRERNRLVIYSTQLVEQACAFSDQVALIADGALTLLDTERDLNRDPKQLAAKIKQTVIQA
jgi:ABC-type multidrug transport system ATPase subunit